MRETTNNTVINNSLSPVVLENGTIIGASGTKAARREGVTLSERDRRRYVETGQLAIITPAATERQPTVTAAPLTEAPAPALVEDKQSPRKGR